MLNVHIYPTFYSITIISSTLPEALNILYKCLNYPHHPTALSISSFFYFFFGTKKFSRASLSQSPSLGWCVSDSLLPCGHVGLSFHSASPWHGDGLQGFSFPFLFSLWMTPRTIWYLDKCQSPGSVSSSFQITLSTSTHLKGLHPAQAGIIISLGSSLTSQIPLLPHSKAFAT